MPFGPGKYAALCNQALLATDADALLLIVINGNAGDGFEVHGKTGTVVDLPKVLRSMADTIEADNNALKNQ